MNKESIGNIDPGLIVQGVGWIIGSLATLVAILLGWDRMATKRSVSALFRWKDNTVDLFMAEVPRVYATKDDIKTYIHEPNWKDHQEIKERLENVDKTLGEMRGLLIQRAKGTE
ncbi:MAG: hypothetical protein M0Z38_07825 [Deltaproteobacteria bacterium]|nr:hypothetical protein [Deltaproteobacteria bacterium]